MLVYKKILPFRIGRRCRMELTNFQFAVFYNNIEPRPDVFMDNLNNNMDGILDNMPSIMPIPLGAPVELPIVQLASSSGRYSVSISRNRADFFINFDQQQYSESLKECQNFAQKFANHFYERVKISRIGIVANIFVAEQKNVHKINVKYFNNGMKGSVELKIRSNSLKNVDNMVLNNIVEISSVERILSPDDKTEKGIFILRDINNQALEQLSLANVKKIIETAMVEFGEDMVKELI